MTEYPVRRNVVLLASGLVCLSGMFQLAVAVATVTLVLVTGVEGILGLGPAIFLVSGALAAGPAGRAMDRYGRMPIIRLGYVAGIAGCAITAAGCARDTWTLVLPGLALAGGCGGVVQLSRAAAAEMFPPDRRARGMSYVLFGSVVGAVLGPFVFGPMFAGKHLTADDLVVPWLAAGAFLVVGLGIAFLVRPDPSTIAKQHGDAGAAPSPLKEILRRPGVPLAMLAAVTSFAVMASVMNLSGYVAVDHGIAQGDVFRIISAHIVGMFGLVIVVGDLIDRMGRQRAITAGLTLMAASTFALVWFESIIGMSVALFGLGLGWSFSYVAATAELVTLAGVNERGRLIGFCDLVASFTAAVLVLVGGAAFTGLGTIGLAVGGTLMAVVPALVLLVFRREPEPALELA